ncbi:phosphate/phosphite/phosphonate ABC transporter substrate-binding protein [Massilia antarctica]|uniref:phosphate/phosphite/phosphonate ABC transporter substrate-binding protein n=1 Tax=Massilia antarctica TaxID=2765360 RepID=UPI0006BCE336|nr:PhnD/SsuA/transferrin family substrate-binding protein [Massilia sp. H27-R4]MCY0914195.1 PhnD/SsuA/transferrin family substrate-binding protein [Massilia sp. H27-R4]CUI08599.1 ABC-type phosphate/phosphonate transport system, periplasmic component [Janthinobacterium sp. CG23_2]CUU32385.1 ABC-type phosphate/phosphonate transport system, periplasmic component [Janthinobacterium sp. CG23_2]
MMWKAAFPMYNVSAEVRAGYEALFETLQGVLRADGFGDAVKLERAPALPDFWQRPDMLLSQTCGYPYLTRLRGYVTLLATPAYAFAGCDGSDYSSAIVVRAGGAIGTLAGARGCVAAVNDIDSNSGMNALRHAVAPLAREGRFFGAVRWSGSHRASLALVQDGEADLAAIDCVTLGYLRREAPSSLDGLAVVCHTAPSPALPFVTGAAVPHAVRASLRSALLAPSPKLANVMAALSIRVFAPCGDQDYARIEALAAEARAYGYPQLA